jgi:hypothetical protein
MQSVIELQSKYVELPEYKKISCIEIDKLVPKLKLEKAKDDDEEEEDISEAKKEALKINRRKRRRYKNSFINHNNLV